MPMPLYEWLERLEDALRGIGRDAVVAALAPGIPPPVIAGALEDLLVESSDLEALYAWHDGTRFGELEPMDDYQIFPGFTFAPFDEVSANYREFVRSDRWKVGWLPVFADGGGDFYLVDTAHGSVVRHFRIDEEEHPVEYSSLADFIATIVAALRQDVIFTDADGFLEMDHRRYGDIAKAMNPTVAWWRG